MHQDGNYELRSLQAQINQETNAFEVGVLVSHDNPGDLVYTYKLRGETFTLPLHNKQLEPVVYPLLFPHGENGWSKDIQETIKFLPYLASRLLMPERDSCSSSGWLERKNQQGKLIRTNRFQLMSRVSQHYIVEGVSRLVDSHLSFVKKRNQEFLGDYADQSSREDDSPFLPREVDRGRQEFNNSSRSFLNDSITGSPRHLKSLAKNCLQVVAEKGKPHIFLTVTANPNWPEITERLFPGQTAYDRYIL